MTGSLTSLPQLADLNVIEVERTQVGVPTEQELATFHQQHPGGVVKSARSWCRAPCEYFPYFGARFENIEES